MYYKETQGLPDQEVDPQLFDVVKTHMVHGPSGSYHLRFPCMKNGICYRDFQRHYTDTDINANLDIFTNRALFALQDVLLSIGGNSLPHYGLPSPQATDRVEKTLIVRKSASSRRQSVLLKSGRISAQNRRALFKLSSSEDAAKVEPRNRRQGEYYTLRGQLEEWEDDVMLALYADDSVYIASACRADLAAKKVQRV
ncbi:hypothetical protein EVAR_64623_1 [Eumeta japonica]|uniref:Uncharacterized protein n=1 Tax=Eumeta variegata TaxID=151549 RepID=A0A4C1ZA54_EUMVA|nr:hypothetical protein EVAR_64623_1 [Eumeta japonica]